MQAYSIKYHLRNEERQRDALIDAKNAISAKKKIGKKHGYKDGRMIVIDSLCIIGYY